MRSEGISSCKCFRNSPLAPYYVLPCDWYHTATLSMNMDHSSFGLY